MNPLTVWSLGDMLRFYAATYGVVMSQLARIVYELTDPYQEDPVDLTEIDRDLTEELSQLPVSRAIRDQYARLKARMTFGNRQEIALLFRELHNSIASDLSSSYFLAIDPRRRPFYEQRTAPFGEAAAAQFPDASRDISAASRCYALDEWTACVFHLMRVLEHGMVWLANDVGLSGPQVENENWKNVIDQIEKNIRSLEQLPKSQAKVERLQFLSSAAAQFRYFKDAWRNHVAHSHQHYDEREADRVWTHVKSFIEILSDHASAQSQATP